MPGSIPAEILQINQFGLEAPGAYGVAVPADKQLLSLRLELTPQIPTTKVLAQGSKSAVGMVIGKEHSEFAVSGMAALNDLAYLFSMCLGEPTITTPATGVTARQLEYIPSTTQPDTFNSFTIEKGDSFGARRVAGVLCDSLSLAFVPDRSVDMTGTLLGKEREGGITLTASPTVVPLIPLDPRGVSIFIADTEAGLAAGQVRPLEATFRLADRHTPVFTLDDSEPSFEDTVERELAPEGQIIVRSDTDADAYLDNLRGADLLFIRYQWTGDIIELALPYRIQIEMPFRFMTPTEGERSDAHVQTFDLAGMDDATFGSSVRVRIQSILTAL
jgi:hypothetical protein